MSRSILQHAPLGLAKLRYVRVPGFTPQAMYSKYNLPTSNEANIDLYAPNHPRRPLLLETLATAPSDVLSWSVTADPSVKVLPKGILRNKLKRRWITAFRTALLKTGYSADGQNMVSNRQRPGLKGRLCIVIYQGQGFNESNDELIQQCRTLITALEE